VVIELALQKEEGLGRAKGLSRVCLLELSVRQLGSFFFV
jgi:hypothetical protein